MRKLKEYFKNKENLFFFSGLVLLIFIPLYPKFPILKVYGTFVAIRLEDFLIGLFLLLWVWLVFKKSLVENFFKEKLPQALLLYFFVGFISIFSATFITHTVSWHLALLHLLRRVELMLLLPAVFMAIRTKWEQKVSLLTLSVVLLIVNIYAFGQKYLHWPLVSTTNSEFSKGQILYLTEGARVNSTFAGHYDLAVFLMMALTILTAMFFVSKTYKQKAWILVLSLTSAAVLVLTAARQSFAAVLAGITLALILVGKKMFIGLLIILAIAAVLYPSPLRDRFAAMINVNLQNEGERYKPANTIQENRGKLNIPTLPNFEASKGAEATFSASRSADIASDIAPGEPVDKTDLEVYRSLNIRLNVEWPRAVNAFVKNPLLGTGFSSLGVATDNDLFRAMGEVGLLGLAAFFLIIWQLYKMCWSIYRKNTGFSKYLSAGCIAMLTAFLINSLFIDVFEASKVAALLWMVLGINLASEKFR